MAEISAVKVGAELLSIKDATARDALAELKERTDTSLEEFRAKVAGIQAKGVFSEESRWCVFDVSAEGRRSVVIRGDTHISLDVATAGARRRLWLDVDEDTSYDLSDMMARAAGGGEYTGGRTFYAYLVPGEGRAELALSLNSTFPNDIDADWTANNTRKVFWFSTVCADCGEALEGKLAAAPGTAVIGDFYQAVPNAAGEFAQFYRRRVKAVAAGAHYDVLTVSHPLAGFKEGDILPESVWCLTFRPAASGGAMVYSPATGEAVDVYKTSGCGDMATSEYGASVTMARPRPCFEDDLLQSGRRLLDGASFRAAAMGSNVGTLAGADDAGARAVLHAGGHSDTEGRRLVSFIGCEDCCGAGWEWGAERLMNGAPAVDDVQGGLGYGQALASVLRGGSRDIVSVLKFAIAAVGPGCAWGAATANNVAQDECCRGMSAVERAV